MCINQHKNKELHKKNISDPTKQYNLKMSWHMKKSHSRIGYTNFKSVISKIPSVPYRMDHNQEKEVKFNSASTHSFCKTGLFPNKTVMVDILEDRLAFFYFKILEP